MNESRLVLVGLLKIFFDRIYPLEIRKSLIPPSFYPPVF